MFNGLAFLEQSVLIDKLAEYTGRYTQLRTEGGSKKEIDNCYLMIERLQEEIERRKKQFSGGNTELARLSGNRPF